MRKLLLRNFQAPGDVLMLTAAVRDLHGCYPGEFKTDVRTSCPQLWENNPYLSPLDEHAADVKIIDCHYPLIHRSNQTPVHFIEGFSAFLNQELGLKITPTLFKGDLHLSPAERSLVSQVTEIVGQDIPYWLVCSGGKRDFTIKWWEHGRYQAIVDHFRGAIQFVQTGASGHFHPELEGVIDLRGKTTVRQLIRLMYHAKGTLTPVSFLMHLSAAVEMKTDVGLPPKSGLARPCVVIAGGREPPQWEAYPTHQFIHTVGMLPCCRTGGCWKSRTQPLGDGNEKDLPQHLCVDVVNKLPRCMDLITVADVVRRIEMYLATAKVVQPTVEEISEVKPVKIQADEPDSPRESPLDDRVTEETALARAEEFIKSIKPYPRRFRGRGIVICGGGIRYFACAWVCISMLRRLKCSLPIQFWYLGRKEMDDRMKRMLKPFKVECVDALEVRAKHPARILNGWELKPFSILHSPFKEVLLLDADNVPIIDPSFLFRTPEYRDTGAVFWPDFGRLKPSRSIWELAGVEHRDEPEFESGQIVINKEKCWQALSLAMWYNENSDFFYQHIHGDKESYHIAFLKLKQSYSMPTTPVRALPGCMCQHDFEGRRIFQHRNLDKWSLFGSNHVIPGFTFESECLSDLERLRLLWQENSERLVCRYNPAEKSPEEIAVANSFVGKINEYHRIGWESRPMIFQKDGTIGTGAAGCELFWDVEKVGDGFELVIASESEITCRLKRHDNNVWRGRWLIHQKMPVVVAPLEELPAYPTEVKPKTRRSRGNRVVLRAPINAYTGYGLHACQIVSDLESFGCDLNIRAIDMDERFAIVPDRIKRNIVAEEIPDEWELLLHPPTLLPSWGKRTVYFTMWESTRLPNGGANCLNRAECIIVPSRWNAECLKLSGVKAPIKLVPLGINTDVFKFAPMNMHGPCVFGAAGRMAHGGIRKGINQVIEAFLTAFPRQKDVRLHVKGFPDCEIMKVSDPRVQVVQECLTEERLARWFAGLTCFVSAARGEGWGLMQQQALACGRPIISVRYGGVAEFFDPSMGYPLAFSIKPAAGHYSGCGDWAEPDHKHLISLMRRVYRDRKEARSLGAAGARSVAHLAWKSSNRALFDVLCELGMIVPSIKQNEVMKSQVRRSKIRKLRTRP